jgi:hypothetical protein
MTIQCDDQDQILWGGEAIGREANVLTPAGNVNMRRTFYLLERGYLPAKKCGRVWTTTRRRLREFFEAPHP